MLLLSSLRTTSWIDLVKQLSPLDENRSFFGGRNYWIIVTYSSFHFFIGFFLRKTGGILGKKLIRRIELPFLLKSSRLALDKVLAMGVGKVGWSHPQ